MITFLRIRNLATIEDLSLDLDDGFSILTGETGAGKSIIIDSIRLILGDKGSSELVRTGEAEAVVEAGFRDADASVPLPGSDAAEGELCLQRHVGRQGTGKAYVGGVLVPAKKMKDCAGGLVDIYGQHDHVFLLNLDNHLDFLDGFGRTLDLRRETARLARELRKRHREILDLEETLRDSSRRLDFLEFQIREIEAADLKPGEEDALHRERHVLKNAEKIASLAAEALEIAYDREDSLSSLLSRLRALLDELGTFDPSLKDIRDSLEPADIALREAVGLLRRSRERQAVSPEAIETVEERLSLIEKLKRKYGRDIADITTAHLRLVEERDRLAHGRERLETLNAETDGLFGEYSESASRLSKKRRATARELAHLVEKEIALLGMNKARFEIRIESAPADRTHPDKARDSGLDDVEFLISPNPGEEVRPLRKIASGGELSRVMLALKSLGRDQDAPRTLIFDEIDAGIGGKTADFIARKLKELSGRHQVLCITHLPQIASHADHHFRIDKRVEKSRTFTTIKKLGFEERVGEIARLISGQRVTPSALENAREMLLHNRGAKPKAEAGTES
ncbi:MAG: DNA repair protein RecN [Candidatus Aminicenantes bacterium]|nr:DNA repair protein RecN [Candidatus Aminicenantes bacterium]